MVKTHTIEVEQGVCDSARELLATGKAQPEDRIEAYRGDQLCLFSTVGVAAGAQVFGNKFVKYNPNSKRNRRED